MGYKIYLSRKGTSLGSALENTLSRMALSTIPFGVPVICMENNELIVRALKTRLKERFHIYEAIVNRVVFNYDMDYDNGIITVFVNAMNSFLGMLKNEMASFLNINSEHNNIWLRIAKSEKEYEQIRQEKHLMNLVHYVFDMYGYVNGLTRGLNATELSDYFLKDNIVPEAEQAFVVLKQALYLYDAITSLESDVLETDVKDIIAYNDYTLKLYIEDLYKDEDQMGRILPINRKSLTDKHTKFVQSKIPIYEYIRDLETDTRLSKLLVMECFEGFSVDRLKSVIEVLESHQQKLLEEC